jgi:glucose/arabinose dehydrogenase
MSHRRLVTAVVAVLVAAVPIPAYAQYTCTGISETPNATLSSVVVAAGLSEPVFVTAPPGETSGIFIVERSGRIKIHKHGQTASTVKTFLDITAKVDSAADSEMGLLGLAFDPSYATTRLFWVYYTETVSTQIFSVVAQYTTSLANPDVADPASEVRVLRVAQPETNHKAGMLEFGSDGFLYVSTGDGGGGGDDHGTCGNGQNRTVLLGKILRLDVRNVDPGSTLPDCGLAGATYRVPASNPFRDGPGIGLCDEIWAYGFRNPWRSSRDALNGDLYVADVGESCWEEVNWTPGTSTGGENYGWRQMEGLQCYNPNQQFTCTPAGAVCAGSPPCNDASIKRPVVNYQHSGLGECAVTGGYVYRGCRMPSYRGAYFYGDFCEGFVKTFRMSGGVATDLQDVSAQVDPGGTLAFALSSFGVDGQGELYIASLGGTVRKVVPPFGALEVSARGAADPFRLSKTGDWTWEDLFLSTDVPISFYRVYRGAVAGAYTCVLRTTTPKWPLGGDPVNPAPGQLFAYVVGAVNATGVETELGTEGFFNPSTCP